MLFKCVSCATGRLHCSCWTALKVCPETLSLQSLLLMPGKRRDIRHYSCQSMYLFSATDSTSIGMISVYPPTWRILISSATGPTDRLVLTMVRFLQEAVISVLTLGRSESRLGICAPMAPQTYIHEDMAERGNVAGRRRPCNPPRCRWYHHFQSWRTPAGWCSIYIGCTQGMRSCSEGQNTHCLRWWHPARI